MNEKIELISTLIAGLALFVSLLSIYLSSKALKKEKQNDFYNRRREILFGIIETRMQFYEASRLIIEVKKNRDKLIAQNNLKVEESIEKNSTHLTDPDILNMLDNLENTIKNLIESTPISVLENAAADVHKMHITTKTVLDEFKQLVNDYSRT